MYREVVIKIKPPPHSWVMSIHDLEYVSVRILDCRPDGKNHVNEFFEIRCSPKCIDQVIEKLNKSKDVDNLEILDVNRKSGIIKGVVKTSYCNVCRAFSMSPESFLKSAVYDIENGYVRWRLIANINTLAKMVGKLREMGTDIEIESVSKVKHLGSEDTNLTIKQEEILKMAWEMGLFDFPRRITLNKFAELVGLSPATVSEILRSGLRKILYEHFSRSKYSK